MRRAFLSPIPYILLFIFLFVESCEPSSSNDDPCGNIYKQQEGQIVYQGEKTDDIVVHLTSEPPNLHPTIRSNINRNIILGYTHFALAAVGEDGELIPNLAESEPAVSEDGLTFSFRVNPAATWEDGRPITAKDVLFSYKVAVYEYSESPAASVYLDFLKDVKVDEKDDRMIHLEMNEFYILNAHSTSNQLILDQDFFDPNHLMDKYTFAELMTENSKANEDESLIAWADEYKSAKYGRELEYLKGGAGPYMIEAWEKGKQVTLVRKQNYWGENIDDPIHAQYPERITFKFISDDQAAALQIMQQEIDVSAALSSDAFDQLKKSEEATCHYNLSNIDRMSVAVILLNNRPDGQDYKKIFDDVKVRRAISLSVPIDAIIEKYLEGTATRLNAPISNNHVDYHQGLQPFPFDPEQANKLLDEAGWVDTDQDGVRDKVIDGQKTDLAFSLSFANTQKALEDIAEEIRIELEGIGVKCTPEPLPSIGAKLYNREFDAVFTALSMSSAPYDFNQLFHSAGWPNGSNFMGYANPQVDLLIEKARTEPDVKKRRDMNNQIQQMLYDEQPVICVFNPTKKIAVHKRFNHVELFSSSPYITVNGLEVIRE